MRDICTSVDIPAVAIGGISAENVKELQEGGMCGVAVVSAVFAAEDIASATAQLKEQVKLLLE